MNMNSIFPIFIIAIYLVIIYLLDLFRNSFKQKKNNYNITKENPIMMLYSYKVNNNKKLFNYTLFNLITKGYYTIYEEKNTTYIKMENKDTDNLYSFEKEVITYINDIIYRKDGKNYMSLDTLKYNIDIDVSFLNSLGNFITHLKKDVHDKVGKLDRISKHIIPFIISFFYSIQVIIFITGKTNIKIMIIGSILLGLLTTLVSSKIKVSNNKYSEICFMILFFVNLLIAYIIGQIWINNSNYDYILFHIIMGLISFLYPALLYLDAKYASNNILYMFNKKQLKIVNKINEILNNRVVKKENEIYYRFYNKKYKLDNNLYNEFLLKFNI